MLSERRTGPLPRGRDECRPNETTKSRFLPAALRQSKLSYGHGEILRVPLRMTNGGGILTTIPADQLTARKDVAFQRALNLLFGGSRGQIQF